MTEKPRVEGMDNPGAETSNADGSRHDSDVQQYIAQFGDEVRMLLLLKNELYEGSWDAMREDLGNRLDGKPYIFKLANRIKDDINRIDELQAYEADHDVDLSEYVMPPSP